MIRNKTRKMAVIHVAKKQTGITDEEYRVLLSGAAGISSAAEIKNEGQFSSVMKAFKNIGFKNQSASSPERKALWLWGELHRRGKVRVPGAKGLYGYIHNRLGHQDVYHSRQWTEIIEQLKKWVNR